jgi:hypothetical protein
MLAMPLQLRPVQEYVERGTCMPSPLRVSSDRKAHKLSTRITLLSRFERKKKGNVLVFRSRNTRVTAMGIGYPNNATPVYPQYLALTSPASGAVRSV